MTCNLAWGVASLVFSCGCAGEFSYHVWDWVNRFCHSRREVENHFQLSSNRTNPVLMSYLYYTIQYMLYISRCSHMERHGLCHSPLKLRFTPKRLDSKTILWCAKQKKGLLAPEKKLLRITKSNIYKRCHPAVANLENSDWNTYLSSRSCTEVMVEWL